MNDDQFNNSLILAVETSGRLGSVAIAEGPQLLAQICFSGPLRASAEIFPAIVEMLSRFDKKPNQIEQVYISYGPGSFTGLRIAVALAKTLALANNTKIVAVDTLDTIAENVLGDNYQNVLKPNERLAAILDAKRGQFFIAVYEYSSQSDLSLRAKRSNLNRLETFYPLTKILPDCLMTAEEFLDRFAGCGKPIALIGEGLVYYKDKFNDPAVRFLDEKYWNPSAANVHHLGWQKAQTGDFADPLALTPNYLRGPDAKIKQI